MNTQEQVKLLTDTATKIFTSKLHNTDITKAQIATNAGTFYGRMFANGIIRGFDIKVKDNTGKIVELRILEQNPNKTDKYNNLSQYAVLARQGKQIVWVIRKNPDTFIAKIIDGKFEQIKPRATTVARFAHGGVVKQQSVVQDQFNQDYHTYDNGEFVADLPEIDPNDVTMYVTGL